MYRKYDWTISEHAAMRMKERNIPHPDVWDLVVCKGNSKIDIKKSCPNLGYKNDYLYFRNQRPKRNRIVYVCKVLGLGKYLLVTAWRVEKQ